MAELTDEQILEDAFWLARNAVYMVDLQYRRVMEGSEWWIDMQFFIVALRRLRNVCGLAGHNRDVKRALTAFDRMLPDLKAMRDIGEHIDAYARGTGKRKDVERDSIEDGQLEDDGTFSWPGLAGRYSLNVNTAWKSANALFTAVHAAYVAHKSPPH